MKPKQVTGNTGALALRGKLSLMTYHLESAIDYAERATQHARELGANDQLAVAAKALRSIANSSASDARSKGLAVAALEKMGVRRARK